MSLFAEGSSFSQSLRAEWDAWRQHNSQKQVTAYCGSNRLFYNKCGRFASLPVALFLVVRSQLLWAVTRSRPVPQCPMPFSYLEHREQQSHQVYPFVRQPSTSNKASDLALPLVSRDSQPQTYRGKQAFGSQRSASDTPEAHMMKWPPGATMLFLTFSWHAGHANMTFKLTVVQIAMDIKSHGFTQIIAFLSGHIKTWLGTHHFWLHAITYKVT